MELISQRKHEYVEYIFDLEKRSVRKFNIDFNEHIRNGRETDLLYFAAYRGYYRSVKALLGFSNHWDINRKQNTKCLLSAAANGLAGYTGYTQTHPFGGNAFAILKLLLEKKGGDLNVKNEWGWTPIDYMIQHRNNKDKWIEYLYDEIEAKRLKNIIGDITKEKIDHVKKMHSKADELARVCKFSDYDALLRIWDDPENKQDISEYVNYFSSEYENRPLDAICRHAQWGYDSENQLESRNFQCFKELLNVRGIKIVSYTIEHLVRNDKYEYIRYLVEEYPFECDLFEFMKILLSDKNIDVNTRDKDQTHVLARTVWARMIRYNRFEYFKYIIESSERNDNNYNWKLENIGQIVNSIGENLLHLAVQYANIKILRYLLNKNVIDDINQIGGLNNDTALTMCISSVTGYGEYYRECDNYKCFRMLILNTSKGQNGQRVDPYIKNKLGYNAFDCCRRVGKMHHLKELQAEFGEK